LSQMGGWATGPTAFKASSQEQNRKLLFFEAYTVLDDICSISFTPRDPKLCPFECPGVPHFLLYKFAYTPNIRDTSGCFFPQSRP
jgi:hypothetical protein